MRAVFALPLLLLLPLHAAPTQDAPASAEPDPLAPVLPLLGEWTGTGKGPGGVSKNVLDVERVIQGKFVRLETTALFRAEGAPDDAPLTEAHENWGMVSYDSGAKVLRLREWHGEGFVNTYALDATPAREGWTSFTTTAIENFAPGWRARWSFRVEGDTLEEMLELQPPDGEWFTCVTASLRRAD